jgi:ABC-2 type transport system ATP-binding protein
VIEDLSFSLEAGERLAVRGPNGSGKTTLLRCLAGALAPTSGTVAVHDLDPTRPEARVRLGAALGDQRSFYRRLTARQNLTLFARLKLGKWAVEPEVRDLERELRLDGVAETPVARCSSGQIQRLALARALIGAPDVLLLDEPTRSMDSEATAVAWSALDGRPQAAVVMATHSSDDAGRCGQTLDLSGHE